MDGTYEERMDYLIPYSDIDKITDKNQEFRRRWRNNQYQMILTPKYGSSDNKIVVLLANITNPDEKITLDKAQVMVCQPAITKEDGHHTPMWSPIGFSGNPLSLNMYDFEWEQPEGLNSADEDYNLQSITALLEFKGYEHLTEYDDSCLMPGEISLAVNKFFIQFGKICLFVAGEPNSGGQTPVYLCEFDTDPNTDMLAVYFPH